MPKNLITTLKTRLVLAQRLPVVGSVIRVVLFLMLGIDIPRSVVIGSDFRLMHGGYGVVIHRNTIIGQSVTIFHGVTIGLGSVGSPDDDSVSFRIGDGVVIGAGAVVLGDDAQLEIGRNSVIGANSVVTHSIGADEVWAGVPARFVRQRP